LRADDPHFCKPAVSQRRERRAAESVEGRLGMKMLGAQKLESMAKPVLL
jgi:hypothetical protein